MVEIPARVLELRYEADSVVSVRLGALDGTPLPDWEPGSHIDLVLPVGLVRQYSIVESDPRQRWYRIAILRDPASRGGSEYVHLFLRPGQHVTIRPPLNHFQLTAAQEYLFIAGGIGITPILSMVDAVDARTATWHLHYAGHSRTAMAFMDRLALYEDRVTCWDSAAGRRLDLERVIPPTRPGLVIYACGPSRLIEAIHDTAHKARWHDQDIHFERFKVSSRPTASTNRPLVVRAARTGKSVEIASDETILSSLTRAGIKVASSCMSGLCGTCEVKVLGGQPDHRDDVLTPAQREAGDRMLVCVSRALSKQLTLDV